MRRIVAGGAVIGSAAFVTPTTASAQPELDAAERIEQASATNYEYTGDGRTDIVARRNPGGNLEIWPGNGAGGLFEHVDAGRRPASGVGTADGRVGP